MKTKRPVAASLFSLSSFVVMFVMVFVPSLIAQENTAPSARLALTPPMGWNSWNKFACNVSEDMIKNMADAVVKSGMKDAGYQYVNIDDCWQVSRDASANIVVDPQRFPHGMKAVGDYIHSLGLKFGVYLSPWDRHEPKYKDAAAYDDYYQAELTELASNYGDLVEFWLDGAGSLGHVYNFPKMIETLRTYQPNTVVFADTGLFEYGDARWVGTESGRVPYENWNVIDRHGYLRWRPVEADTPLRKEH